MDKKAIIQLPSDYSEDETQQRVETALRGAREVGHKTMKSISTKRSKKQRKQPRKSRAST